MFGIGMTELMVILVLALLVIGPQKLPALARSLGKGLAEFRRASTDIRREFLEVTDDARIDPFADERERASKSQPEDEAKSEPVDEAKSEPGPESTAESTDGAAKEVERG